MPGLFGNVNPFAKPKPKPPTAKPPKKPKTSSEGVSFGGLGLSNVPNVYNTQTTGGGVPLYQEARAAQTMGLNPGGISSLAGWGAQTPAAAYGNLMGGNSGGGGRAGGGGGGGGGGPNLDEIRALAGELFTFNADPYNQWRQSIEQQYQFNPQPYNAMRQQATGYNPDFAAMEQQAVGSVQAAEAQRQAAATQRLQQVRDLINQVGYGFSQNMGNAVRDLAGQGVNAQPFLDQSSAMGANLAQGGANQLGLGGNLDQIALQNQTGTLQGLAQTRLGGEAALANNRGQLLNQIATQQGAAELANNQARTQALGQLGVQQSQAQMALEQAKREFMLKYGL